MVQDPLRTRSLRLHKPSALFPQRSLPRRSRAFVLRSDAISVVVHHVHALTLLLPRLRHDGSAPNGVGHGYRWPHC
jgi:hypothetical protein